MQNVRTNTIGILGLVSSASALVTKLLSGHPLDAGDLAIVTGAITSIGLLFSKDHNK